MVILVDFDNTVYDTKRLVEDRKRKYESAGISPDIYDRLYEQIKQEFGYFLLEELYRRLDQREKGLGEKVRKIDEDLDYSKYLLPYARGIKNTSRDR